MISDSKNLAIGAKRYSDVSIFKFNLRVNLNEPYTNPVNIIKKHLVVIRGVGGTAGTDGVADGQTQSFHEATNAFCYLKNQKYIPQLTENCLFLPYVAYIGENFCTLPA